MKSICPVSANPSIQTLLPRRWRNALTMRVIHARTKDVSIENTTRWGPAVASIHDAGMGRESRLTENGRRTGHTILCSNVFIVSAERVRRPVFSQRRLSLVVGRSVKPETSSGNKPRHEKRVENGTHAFVSIR